MAFQSVCIKGMASVTLLSKTATNTMTTKTTRTVTKTKGGLYLQRGLMLMLRESHAASGAEVDVWE